jgi:predicted ATPase/DNA-binding winged helix-turn-helix (wHTH) protein
MSDQDISFGPFRLIASRRLLLEGGRPLHIGSRALTMLKVLLERAGEVVEKKELARLVWPNTFVDEANIRVHISALRRALGDGQNGQRYIVNVPGRGYCFAGSVSRGLEVPHAARLSESDDRPSWNLPNFITRLVGRNDAVAKLKTELTRERMVTIVGPGGIGKTSLALAATPSWVTESGYDVGFVDLATVTDPASVPAAVASAISTTTIHEDIAKAMLRELRNRRLLIILDNCEHVVSAVASLCELLLTGTKDVRLLATSREALQIPSEWIHRLAPLRTPPADTTTAAEAIVYPAVQLFVERAMANVDTYEFRDEDAPSVVNICRRLDGIPLALEFAAARIDLLDVHTIAEGLNDRFALLTKGHRNALPRQQTLRAVLEWSCGLLSTDRKIVLRRLSVFAGPFGVDDAVDVVSSDNVPRLTVLESLSDLVAKSILIADVSGHAVSYRLLETTQIYAYEQLRSIGEAEAVRRRHARRFLEICRTSVAADGIQRSLREAMVDVRVALDWALVSGCDVTLGIDLASAATPIFLRLALLREHRKYLELALAHLAAADAKPGTKVVLSAEMALRTAIALALYYTEGSETASEDHLQKARVIAQKTGDTTHELKVLWMLYGIAGNSGNYRKELAYAKIYDETARTSTDVMAEIRRHRILGRSLGDLGRYAPAREHLELALLPDRASMPRIPLDAYEIDNWIAARANLARVLWLQGFPDDAKSEADQCIAEALRLGHEQSTCWALAFNVCPLAIWRGRLDEAKGFVDLLLERSQNVFEHYHDWGLLYRDFLDGGSSTEIERGAGWYTDVKSKIPAQIDLFATFHDKFLEPANLARVEADADSWCAAEILRVWAHRRFVSGEEDERPGAEAVLVRSLDIARRQGAKAWELRTASTLASLYRGSGRIAKARADLESVLGHFTQGRETRDVRAALQLLSELQA